MEQNKTRISASVVADSTSRGHRLTSLEIVFPRIILSEKNTHRALSKNLSSSRAIPFKRMLKTILQDPFIPIAFQKEHTGMQGTEYHNPEAKFNINDAVAYIYQNVIIGEPIGREDIEYNAQVMKLVSNLAASNFPIEQTLVEWWLAFRDLTAMCATLLYSFKVTKQLANRLLEPFMWAKALVSGTDEGWENFFNLRCPIYEIPLTPDSSEVAVGRSWKDLMAWSGTGGISAGDFGTEDVIERLQWNKGQAEIHMMALAEAIYDAMNESKPKELKAGEWHIPYGNKIDEEQLHQIVTEDQGTIFGYDIKMLWGKIKTSTGMSAITSYTVVGDEKEKPYQTLIGIHDKMIVANPFHASPFEHCAQVPTEEEYVANIKGPIKHLDLTHPDPMKDLGYPIMIDKRSYGWFRNFHGWKQYRQIIEDGEANT